MILFCLPYAGGSEGVYSKWKNYLDNSVKLYPIALKGRGRRFYDDFYEDLNEAVDDIFISIKEILNKENHSEYAIYGHSMGSLLAYELYYKLKSEGMKKPSHIFFSGYGAPNLMKKKEAIHELPDDKFIQKVIELGGTSDEILDNEELLELFIPILRSDFKIINQYKYIDREDKIESNISILNGEKDDIDIKSILEWRKLGNKEFNIYNFDGDHFFINNYFEEIIGIINRTLNKVN